MNTQVLEPATEHSDVSDEGPIPESASDLPQLWAVTTLSDPKLYPDALAMFEELGSSFQHSVLVTPSFPTSVEFPGVHIQVSNTPRQASLWNAGLDFIHRLHPVGEIWDVLLIDPLIRMSMRGVDELRDHMRMLDAWIAKPDILFGLSGRPYQRFDDVDDPNPEAPIAAVVAGEFGTRFDPGYRRFNHSWDDFRRRSRMIGGSVVVSGVNCVRTLR